MFTTEMQPPELFCKNVLLEISQNPQENTRGRVYSLHHNSILIKLQASNTFFIEHLWWLLLLL